MNLFIFVGKPLQKCTHMNFPNSYDDQIYGVEIHEVQTDRRTFKFIQIFSAAAEKLIYENAVRRRSIFFFLT